MDRLPLAKEGRDLDRAVERGHCRQVVDFGSQPGVMPDGERIVFTSDAGGMAAQSVLWVVHRDGSDRDN